MSRKSQIEHLNEREAEHLSNQLHDGAISLRNYNAALRDLRREELDAYQQEMEDARERVNNEWGSW